jgi:hypothetical protein
MPIPLTFATLALMTAAMIILGAFWLRVPPGLRFFLPRAAIVLVLLHGFFVITRWGTTSERLNALINWLAVAGYELLMVLFARLSPKWLTSLSAAILIVPLFAASIVMPLTLLFQQGTIKAVSISNNLYYRRVAWVDSGATPGVDLNIYYRPRFFPFLSRKIQTQSFNSEQCDASSATVLPGSDSQTVIAHCPHRPSQPPGSDNKILQLP